MKKRIVCEKKKKLLSFVLQLLLLHTPISPKKKGKKEHHIRYLYRKSELVSPPYSKKTEKRCFFLAIRVYNLQRKIPQSVLVEEEEEKRKKHFAKKDGKNMDIPGL